MKHDYLKVLKKENTALALIQIFTVLSLSEFVRLMISSTPVVCPIFPRSENPHSLFSKL